MLWYLLRGSIWETFTRSVVAPNVFSFLTCFPAPNWKQLSTGRLILHYLDYLVHS